MSGARSERLVYTDEMAHALSCPTCGGALTPEAGRVRTTCPYCGAMVDVTTEGALKVAAALERHGIRVPENPMTRDQIKARLDGMAEVEARKRRRAIIAAVVFAFVFLAGLAVVMLVR
jgi:uncharacterized Zn finger protein (UPF0148 family)